MDCAKLQPGVRKGKKKQVKDELDRLKQAEKKKRRLEKALATSAAIRSELEKKKQRKKEEQQRLDEEGAAIAEAVALHVLLGEDSDDSRKIMLKNEEGFSPLDANGVDIFVGGRGMTLPHQNFLEHSQERVGWAPNFHGSGWNEWRNSDWSFSPRPFMRNVYAPYIDERGWEAGEISAGVIASQAIASLHLTEDEHVDAYVFNSMLHG